MEKLKTVMSIRNLQINIPKRNTSINIPDMDIFEGDFIYIKGMNGTGKTTFIKQIYFGYEESEELNYFECSNDALIKVQFADGYVCEDITDESFDEHRFRNRVSYLDQFISKFSYKSAYYYVIEPVLNGIEAMSKDRYNRMFEISKAALEKKAKKIFKKIYHKYLKKNFKDMPFWKLKFRFFKNFSGGQRKMLHFVQQLLRVIIIKNQILILDEPLNDLDSNFRKVVNDLLDIARSANNQLIIFMVSHCNVIYGVTKVLDFTVSKDDQLEVKMSNHNTPNECLSKAEDMYIIKNNQRDNSYRYFEVNDDEFN